MVDDAAAVAVYLLHGLDDDGYGAAAAMEEAPVVVVVGGGGAAGAMAQKLFEGDEDDFMLFTLSVCIRNVLLFCRAACGWISVFGRRVKLIIHGFSPISLLKGFSIICCGMAPCLLYFRHS